jgi:hypothetical protein
MIALLQPLITTTGKPTLAHIDGSDFSPTSIFTDELPKAVLLIRKKEGSIHLKHAFIRYFLRFIL